MFGVEGRGDGWTVEECGWQEGDERQTVWEVGGAREREWGTMEQEESVRGR